MKTLTDADFQRAAATLKTDQATVRAVCVVEAPRGGFLPSGEPVILFEAHIFSKLTGHKWDQQFPDISSRTWNRTLYRTGLLEHDRLQRAVSLDRDAAMKAASWGRFQILGLNFQRCGFGLLQTFVNAMYQNEGRHLDAFVAYVMSYRLDDDLRAHDWLAFAEGYNGPAFAENHYDERLAAAYASLAPAPDRRVV